MKKSLVALAVLAASGAAMAQSSVTLYGLIDTYGASVKWDKGVGVAAPGRTTTAAAVNTFTTYSGTTQTMIQGGGVNGSRWGLKGSEDLGGGLSATFNLEAGLDSDTGAASSALAFHRQANVGFTGSFGTVRIGRINNYYYDAEGAYDGVFNSALSAAAVTFRSAIGGDTSIEKANFASRFDNSVRYDSPNVSGFVGSVHYGLTENKTATVSAGANLAAGVAYSSGPLTAGLAYDSEKSAGNVEAKTNLRLGATYNFGAAKLKASYGIANNIGNTKDAKANEYQIGVDVPVSAALTLSANVASSKDNKEQDANEGKRTGFGVGAAYTLSKRTFLYGGYVNGKKTATGSTSDATISAFAVGVQHRF